MNKEIICFDKDMDGYMSPTEGGAWVRSEDAFQLQAELEKLQYHVHNVEEFRKSAEAERDEARKIIRDFLFVAHMKAQR